MASSLRRAHVGSIGLASLVVLALGLASPSWSLPRTGSAPSTDLVVNGTFSSGAKGFTSQYTESTSLGPPQTYTIGLDPKKYNGYWPTIKPHAAVGMMMIVNGAITARKTIWSETVAVRPHASYVFALWVASLYASPPVLAVTANGAMLGSAPASQTVGVWKELRFTWGSGSARSVRLSLVDKNLAFGGNDFALSEIALDGPAA
jgi:hypothetical protein